MIVRALGVKVALSAKAQEGNVVVVDNLLLQVKGGGGGEGGRAG